MQIDDKTIKKLGLAAAGCILFAWLLMNTQAIGSVVGTVWGILFPFVLGFILAFLFNIPMKSIETRFLKRVSPKRRRWTSFIITVFLLLAVLAFVIFLVVPQLVDTIATLGKAMPGYFAQLEKTFEPYLSYLPTVQQWLDDLNLDWESIVKQVSSWVQTGAGNVLSSVVGIATSIAGGFFSFFVGIVFACYLLLDKERFTAQFLGMLKAYLPKDKVDKLLDLGHLISHTYAKFISGQCTEALIVGVIYIIALTVGRFDYPLLIGVIVGITTLIPLIGAYLGCFFGMFLLFVSMGFWRTVAFVIMFVIIQQIEGNLIYPHVVGNSVGLPPVWIMVAVIVGGGLAGIFGALFFIPLFSVVYTLVRRDALSRLNKKGIPSPVSELPHDPKKPHKKRRHFFGGRGSSGGQDNGENSGKMNETSGAATDGNTSANDK